MIGFLLQPSYVAASYPIQRLGFSVPGLPLRPRSRLGNFHSKAATDRRLLDAEFHSLFEALKDE